MIKFKKEEEVEEVRPRAGMTTNGSEVVPGAISKKGVRAANIDEVVVDGKLFKKEAYQENGATHFKLVEVK